MGRKSRFPVELSAWVGDQLLRVHGLDGPRTPQVWRSLHAAFLEAFPRAADVHGDPLTLARYKAHVQYLERRRETQLAARAAAHLRRHELRAREQPQPRHTEEEEEAGGEDGGGKSRAVGEQGEEEDDDDEMADDGAWEIRVKREPLQQTATAGRAPPPPLASATAKKKSPPPLLRTRVTAAAALAEEERSGDAGLDASASASAPSKRQFGVRRRRFSFSTRDGDSRTTEWPIATTAAAASPTASASQPPGTSVLRLLHTTKRQRVDVVASPPFEKTEKKARGADAHEWSAQRKALERQVEEATRDAQKWKTKYERETGKLAVEKEALQLRLDEALAALEQKEAQLRRQRAPPSSLSSSTSSSTSSASSAAATSTGSTLTFTINVNVDVSQNGEPLQTTAHALRVDAPTNASHGGGGGEGEGGGGGGEGSRRRGAW